MKSWDFFDKLLEEANVVGTPGSGFGPSGEGYFRLTAFGTQENSIEAINRIKEIKWQDNRKNGGKMLAYIKGELATKARGYVVIDVGGLGYV